MVKRSKDKHLGITFDRESLALTGAEVSVDGASVLTARFSNFTMEMKQDDTGDTA